MGWNKATLRIYDMGSELQLKKKPARVEIAQSTPGAKKPDLDELVKKFE